MSNAVSNIFALRDGFNNKAQAVLKKYGDQSIESIFVFRAPVNGSPLIVKVLNGLSTKNMPYDKLFHLGFLISIGGARIRIEKNEVIDIDEVYTLKPETETILVPPKEVKIILNDFLNNAVNKFGKERIFKYSAFKYNCQSFVKDTLDANYLYNSTINSFVYQPMENVVQNLKGFVPTVANAVTNTAAFVNRLIGRGNTLSKEELQVLMKVLKLLEQ